MICLLDQLLKEWGLEQAATMAAAGIGNETGRSNRRGVSRKKPLDISSLASLPVSQVQTTCSVVPFLLITSPPLPPSLFPRFLFVLYRLLLCLVKSRAPLFIGVSTGRLGCGTDAVVYPLRIATSFCSVSPHSRLSSQHGIF